LLVVSLGVLLANRIASASAATATHARETADSRTTETSVSGTATAGGTATAQQIANVTATAQATVHYPYKAVAPGPQCDKGNAPWTPVVPASSIKCFPTFTQITTNTSVYWRSQLPNTLPSSFTVSVEVTYLTQDQAATLSVFESDRENGTLTLGNDGTLLWSWCIQTSGCQGNGTGVNPGIHTLAITVNGSSVTFLIDNSPVFHATAAKGTSVGSIALGDSWYTVYHVQGYGDFTKFEIT
jgi:hypothetical protein